VTRRPAPALAAWIERYVGYAMSGFPAGVHRGLPSRHMTLIVSIGEPIDVVAQTDPGQAPARYRAVAGGLQVAPALIAHDGTQEGVAVELTPLGCRALLGMPAGALWNTSAELADVVGPPGAELWERLQGPAPWEARFATCDLVLGRLLRDSALDPSLGRAWGLLVASWGAMPVETLARTVGWSRHHLARRFAGEFGLAPKSAAWVMRFDRARRMLQGPERPALAWVAARCGYADQAHLAREFADLAGCPPTRLLADEDLPSTAAAGRAG
jgi:AraC-like DNA-binding protein